MNAPIVNDSNKDSIVDHDPQYIRFTYWSTLLSFNANHPTETSEKQKTIFLNSDYPGSLVKEGVVNTFISVRNNCNSPVLNFNIFSKKAGEIIFKLPELPNKKSFKLEFKKEGIYEMYFFIAGSTSFSKITLNIFPETTNPPSKNFNWDLKSSW